MTNQTVTAADIQGLRRSAAVAGDHLQVLICGMALHGGERSDDDMRLVPLSQHHLIPAGEAEAIAACTEALESARAMDDSGEEPYEALLPRALEWASACKDGEYLVEYSETGMTDVEDPGSRCGYDDVGLDKIRRVLSEREMTLEADDRGLVARAVRS